MIRRLHLSILCVLACLWVFGCAKSEDRQRAERAKAGLMPSNPPSVSTDFVADQTKVVAVSPRNLSYEPLETFRVANARRAAERLKANAPAAPASSGDATMQEAGFWTRVGLKTLMGGAAAPPPPDDAAEESGDAASGDEDDWDDDDWDEDDSSGE